MDFGKIGLWMGIASVGFAIFFHLTQKFVWSPDGLLMLPLMTVGCSCYIFWHVAYVTLISFYEKYKVRLTDTVLSITPIRTTRGNS